MATERAGGIDRWVIEVIALVVLHPEFVHHPPRADVDRGGERNDFEHPESIEAVRHRTSGRLRRVPTAPEPVVEPPTDLHRRCEMGVERCGPQSGETDERCGLRQLNGPEPEALVIEVLLDAIDQRVALAC